nr:ATP-dependent Clp protease ATP-binding subunit [Patescibacteria group bacterium]
MFEPDLLARFTNHLKEVLQKALSFALHNGRDTIEAGDLLVALLQEKGCIGGELLQKAGIPLEAAETQFALPHTARAQGAAIVPDLTSAVKGILEKCVLIAHVHEHKYIGTEHLLTALVDADAASIHLFFQEHNVQVDLLREQVTSILKSTSRFPDLSKRMTESPEEAEEEHAEEAPPTPEAAEARPRPRGEKRPKALEIFARDLTIPETAALLDPVIGRDTEIERVMEILCRRTKNNPILLGEPGVGKTAIVEGLAQKLALGDVPDALQGKRLLAIDLALLVAGTMYRGEFEARLKQVVDEAKADKNIILFIDEIHNMVGAGSTSGSLDAANILKPALSRGEIRCIGATTWAEYKKFIEPDAALERRYQAVTVSEPSAAATREILQGLKKTYEEHHGVRYENEALDAAVTLAERYLTDRFFPDKAIDLLDDAAAHVIATRRTKEKTPLQQIEISLRELEQAKTDAVTQGNLQVAAAYLSQEKSLLKEKKRLEKQSTTQKDRPVIQMTDIASVVARLSQVKVETILATEREQLTTLESRIGKELFGQQDAIAGVADVIRRARLGLSDPRRPKASFLFVGPSGVGKTELARLL